MPEGGGQFHANCVSGYLWEGTPRGVETTLGKNRAYRVGPLNEKEGEKNERAVLLIHDAGGWTFKNLRLMADYYAEKTGAVCWMPDFFDNEALDIHSLLSGPASGAWGNLDMAGFTTRNSKQVREPEIFAAAATLRSEHGVKKIGTVGFCFGGWAVFRLSAQVYLPGDGSVMEAVEAEKQGKIRRLKEGQKGDEKEEAIRLVDAISTAHPTWLTQDEMAATRVPTQILAPEHDVAFSPEDKAFANKVIPELGVYYHYQLFPGVEHAFATRGSKEHEGESAAADLGMSAVVWWFNEFLKV